MELLYIYAIEMIDLTKKINFFFFFFLNTDVRADFHSHIIKLYGSFTFVCLFWSKIFFENYFSYFIVFGVLDENY
jgi:hypothetical protein